MISAHREATKRDILEQLAAQVPDSDPVTRLVIVDLLCEAPDLAPKLAQHYLTVRYSNDALDSALHEHLAEAFLSGLHFGHYFPVLVHETLPELLAGEVYCALEDSINRVMQSRGVPRR